MESNTPSSPILSTPNPRNGGGRAAVVGGVLLAATLVGLGVVPRLRQHTSLTEAVASAKSEQKKPLVEFVALDALPPAPTDPKAAVKPTDNPNDVTLPASIQAIQEATISARTTGYLRQRYVDIGSRVKAGQLLAEIESPEVDQQHAQAQAETVKSQAGTGQAQAEVARLQAGVAQSNADTQKAIAAREQTRSARTRAVAKLAGARAAVANARSRQAQAEQALEGRKADLEQIQAQLTLDQTSYKRWQELGKQGAVSQQDVDVREASYKTRLASSTSAQAAIHSAEADVDGAKQMVQSSLADVQAAQADVSASDQDFQAAQAQSASSRASTAAAQASVTASRANVRAAQAQVGADAANVERFGVLRSFEKVTAPFSGIVTRRDVDNGALITAGGAGSNLFAMARTDTLRIQVSVPQSVVAAIHAGQKVDVLVKEFPGRTFTGVIYNTAGALSPTTRTLLTEIQLPNPKNVLMPGMYAQVRFAGLTRPGANGQRIPHIPANTLISDASGTRVASVAGDGKVHFITVTLGRDYGTELEVLDGLTGHEHLITNPSDDLVEGQTVEAKAAAAPPAPSAPGSGAKKS
jgi:RND family efflux transporter MFP subunit